eukprot:sb/3469425/
MDSCLSDISGSTGGAPYRSLVAGSRDRYQALVQEGEQLEREFAAITSHLPPSGVTFQHPVFETQSVTPQPATPQPAATQLPVTFQYQQQHTTIQQHTTFQTQPAAIQQPTAMEPTIIQQQTAPVQQPTSIQTQPAPAAVSPDKPATFQTQPAAFQTQPTLQPAAVSPVKPAAVISEPTLQSYKAPVQPITSYSPTKPQSPDDISLGGNTLTGPKDLTLKENDKTDSDFSW